MIVNDMQKVASSISELNGNVCCDCHLHDKTWISIGSTVLGSTFLYDKSGRNRLGFPGPGSALIGSVLGDV